MHGPFVEGITFLCLAPELEVKLKPLMDCDSSGDFTRTIQKNIRLKGMSR